MDRDPEKSGAPIASVQPRLRMRLEFEGPRTRGIDLIERLLTTGERHDGPLSQADAEDALEGLERLKLPWLVEGMVEGGEQFARQVHAEMGRGLQEVVQNAQDQGARNIRFGWRAREGRNELLIAHDGEPVALHDVVFMAYPLVSGSREDPERIGRFGIGLKTLNQLGDRLAVHCPPLSFEIRAGRVLRHPPARRIKGFWSPDERETLFVLRLTEGLGISFFRDWFREWDAESLLFLRRLRRLTFVDLRSRRLVVDHQLVEARSDTVSLDVPGGETTERLVLRDVKSGRQWSRYTVRYPTPRRLRDLKDVDKKFGAAVTLSVAVSHRGSRNGRIYAGLPLDEESSLTISMSAPFFVNVDRTALREDRQGANQWLIDRLGDVIAAVALLRFAERPSSGWRGVPLWDEGFGEPGTWLARQGDAALERARARVRSRLRFRLADGDVRVTSLTFEEAVLDGLLTENDQERLRPGRRAVPDRFRDGGRWRDALDSLGVDDPIGVFDAMQILEWDESALARRGATWLVKLAAAGVEKRADYALRRARWIRLADGRRLSPDDVVASGTLLVQRADPGSLSSLLGVAHPISSAFMRSEAKSVRQWLDEHGVLRSRASSADALRALARGDGQEPVDLSAADHLVVQVRDAFGGLSNEEQDRLGEGIGSNVAIGGREYDAKGEPIAIVVVPARAYLPSSIDKSEGWSTAAARTPGISWIDRRYAEVLRVDDRARIGALAFLRKLGAQVAPRLEPVPEPSRHVAWINRSRLPAQHRAELEAYGDVQALLDDWVSPDLERVVANVMRERTATSRRRRARALFVGLSRAWHEAYADRSTAVPAYFRYSWQRWPAVSATWVARLASMPWLTTQEVGLHPKAPRDLRILTGAAHGLAGEDPSLYVEEIDEEFADSPLAGALGITGRPRASDLLELLEQFREDDLAGRPVDSRRIQRCYDGLARYSPGGPDAERADLTPGQIRAAFGRSTSKVGLVRHGTTWIPPARARRGESLSDRLPTVRGAEQLWDLLGVQESTISDCVEVFESLAGDGTEEMSAQIRLYRRMLDLVPRERHLRQKLASLPFYTGSGWLTGTKIYAVANPAMAVALASKVPVWKPPLALEEMATLLPYLTIRVLDEHAVEPVIDTTALVAGETIRQDFPAAVEHFKNALFVYHAEFFERVPESDWRHLQSARIAIGTNWRLKARVPGRRAVTVAPEAYLFREPFVFCALDEDELGAMGTGGQAVASFFTGTTLTEHDRAFVAMAWERAFRQRQDAYEALAETEDAAEDIDDRALPIPKRRGRAGKKRRRARAVQERPGDRAEPVERELIDPAGVDLHRLRVTVLASKRKGQLRPLKRRPLKEPDRNQRKKPAKQGQSPGRPHIAKEREQVGYELVEDYLAMEYGLQLTDYRARTDIGADGVDHDEDLWMELKAHAGPAPDTIMLTASEAERAREKRENYWLVIASGLEKGSTPELLIVPNPLTRLDTYIGGGIRLVGLQPTKATATS